MYRKEDLMRNMTPEEHAEADYIAGLVGKIVALVEDYEALNSSTVHDPKRVKDLNNTAVGEAYDWSNGQELKNRQ